MLDSCKMVEKQSEAFYTFLWFFFPSLQQNSIAYRSSKMSDCIFEIHQLWRLAGCILIAAVAVHLNLKS